MEGFGVPFTVQEMVCDVPAIQFWPPFGEVTVKFTPDVTKKFAAPEVWPSGFSNLHRPSARCARIVNLVIEFGGTDVVLIGWVAGAGVRVS